jgi:predicted RNA-binding Zn ribbon-like protein
MNRTIRCVLGASAYLVGAAPVWAQSGNVRAFTKILVDLNAAAIEGTLPFEVPFILTGTAPARTIRLRIEVANTAGKRGGSQAQSQSQSQCSTEQPGDQKLFENAPGYEWRQRNGASTTDTPFAIPILDPLAAQQTYRFRFTLLKQLDADAAMKFTKDAATRIDRALSGVSLKTPSDAVASVLRETLRQEFRIVLGCGRVLAASSLFGDDATWVDHRREFLARVVRDVLTPQRAREVALDQYDISSGALSEALSAQLTSPALSRFFAAAATVPEMKVIVDRNKDGVSLIELQKMEIVRLATGQPPTGDDLDVMTVADSASMIVVKARYSTLFARIAALREAMERLTDDARFKDMLVALIKRKSLSQSDLDDVRAGIAKVTIPLGLAGQIESQLGRAAVAIAPRTRGILALADAADVLARDMFVEEAQTSGDYQTQATWYVSADAGLAWGTGLSTVVPYVGTNVYFRPINKNAPLRDYGDFWHRFSLTIGTSVKTISDNATRFDIFGTQAVIAGAGLRVTQSLRLGAGTIVFKKLNENPLRTDKVLATDLYFGGSFDLDVVSTLGKFGTFFQ